MSALVTHLNAGNLSGLPTWSGGPRFGDAHYWEAVKTAGYTGVQHYWPENEAMAAGLTMSGMGRVTAPEAMRPLAAQHKAWGFVATTLHVGTGLETDIEMDRLAAAVLDAKAAEDYALHIETHRATITQDIRRTLDLLTRFPELTFNADLSHWYTGHEMPYGDIGAKFAMLEPVLARVRFIHGRVGHSCAMQIPLKLAGEVGSLGHFKALWGRIFALQRQHGETIIFAPELLPLTVDYGGQTHWLNYAPLTPDGDSWREVSDRWAEAITLSQIARDLHANAKV